MVYLKSLSTKLISIYVSLFLVYSPLFGQIKQDGQVMTQSEYEKKGKWNIQLIGGDSFANVALWDLSGDSLVVSDLKIPRTIHIGSMVHISTTNEKSKAWKYAKIGIIIGVALPLFATVVVLIDCDGFDNCVDGDVSAAGPLLWFALTAPPLGLISAGVGAVIGSQFKHVEEYDMSDLSIEEKRGQIQKLMMK